MSVDTALLAVPSASLPLDDASRRALLAHKTTLVDREHGYVWAHRQGQDIDFIEAALFVGSERSLLVLKTARRAPKGAKTKRGPVTLQAFRVDATCDARSTSAASCLTLTDVSADAFPPSLPRGDFETAHIPRFGTTLLVLDAGDYLRLPFDGQGRFVEQGHLASQQACDGSIFTGPPKEAQRFAGRLDVDGGALVLCGEDRDFGVWFVDDRRFRGSYRYRFRNATVAKGQGRLVVREELAPGLVAQTTFAPSTSKTPLLDDGSLDVAVSVQRECVTAKPLPPSTQAMLNGAAPLPRDVSIETSACASLLPKQPYEPVTRPLPPVAQFTMALGTGCARFADGGVACYGVVDDDPIAFTIAGLPPVDHVEVGVRFACARAAADRRLWCFGDNGVGQLGTGKPAPKATPRSAPVAVPDLVVDEFIVGDGHVCARVGGDVWCWGADWSGESGGGGKRVDDFHPKAVLKRQRVMTGATRLFGGANTTCATDVDGALWCWGDQDAGYEGKGQTAKPKRIDVPGRVASMSFASGHSCLRTDAGAVWCRGWNPGGQLGRNGTPQSDRADHGDFSAAFVQIAELPKADALVASRNETCVVSAGALYCLGTRGIATEVESSCRSFPVDAPKGRKRAAYRQFTCELAPDDTAPLRDVAATMGARCVVGVDGVVSCVGVADPAETRFRPLRLR